MLQVQLYSKFELLKMGYLNNNEKDDFLNLMAGKVVTIDINNSFSDFDIYVCYEYQNYAIYKCFIKKVIDKDELLSFPVIAKVLNLKIHEVSFILKNILFKIRPLLHNYEDCQI